MSPTIRAAKAGRAPFRDQFDQKIHIQIFLLEIELERCKPSHGQVSHEIRSPQSATKAILVLLAATAVLAVLWMLKYAGRGFSFSDEGFYLNWMANASLYKYTSTLFGFVYRPLYLFVGGDVAYLRGLNLVFTFLLALEVGALVFLRIGNDSPSSSGVNPGLSDWKKGWCYALAAPVAIVSWSMPHSWLLTPSYNTLVLQGFLIAASGVLRLQRVGTNRKLKWDAAALLAIGVWLSGMAKPTSAALLAIAVVVYGVVTGRLSWKLFFVVGLLTLLLFVLSMICVDGSILDFIARLRGGAQLAVLMGAGYGMGQMVGRFFTDSVTFSSLEWSVAVGALLITTLATLCARATQPLWRRCGWFVGFLATAISAAIVITDRDLPYQWASFEWILILSPVIGCAIGRAILQPRMPTPVHSAQASISTAAAKHIPQDSRLALGVFLVFLPHLSAFGSNNNAWLQGGYAAVFWAYGGLVLASSKGVRTPRGPEQWIPVIAAMQLIAIAVLNVTIGHPYTQTESLRLQHTPVTMHEGTTTLLVTPDVAHYLGELQRVARDAGYQPGDGVIDLTGYYAATLFAIAAKPLGSAWLVGGRPGTNAITHANLDQVPCEQLGSAWLLIDAKGPIHIPGEVLARYGIDVETDYESVATVKAPWPIPGQYFNHQFMKPRRPLPQALSACSAARNSLR